MKFQLAINMERLAPDLDMTDVERHTLEMVQMADEGGFAIAWAAEHHALEMTIAPNPFPDPDLVGGPHVPDSARLGGGGGGVLGTPSRPQARRRCWISTAAGGSSSASAPAPTSASSTACTPA